MSHVVRRVAVPLVSLLVAGVLTAVPAGSTPTWVSPSVPLSPVDAVSSQQQIAINDTGVAVAVWRSEYSSPSARSVVQVSTHPVGGSWSAPDDVSASDGHAEEPQVAIDPAGNALAVWVQADATPFIEASRRPAGGSWSEPVTISDASKAAAHPKLAVDDAGNAVAIWNAANKVNWAALPLGGSWSAAAPFASSLSGDDIGNALTMTPGGVATAAWTDLVAGREVVMFASRQPGGGSWTTPDDLSPAAEDASDVNLSSSASGKALVTWVLFGPATPGPGNRYVVQARVRPDATSAWGSVEDLSVSSSTPVNRPRGAMDDIGRAAVVWSRFDADLNHDVVETAKYTVEDVWTGRVDVSASFDAITPDVAIAGDGHVVAVWRDDGSAKIQTARRPIGLTSWGEPEDLTDGTPKAEDPRAAADQAGNTVAVWADLVGASGSQVTARALDVAGPVVASVSIPGKGQAEKPVTFSVDAVDAWSTFTVVWTFGDGEQATGLMVQHTYAKKGQYRVDMTATDAVGNVTTTHGPIFASDPLPRLSGVLLTKSTIHVLGSAQQPRATQLKFTLNTKSSVTVKLTRTAKLNGRTVEAKLVEDLAAGQHSIRLTSKIGAKRLPPGTYRVAVTAHNQIGTSKPKVVQLTIRR